MDKRITVAIYIVAILFSVSTGRLWYLQVIRGGEYDRISEQNRLRVIDIPAPRGIIYDRNDIPLVKNIPSFDISVLKEELPDDPDTLSALGRLIGLPADDIRKKLARADAIPFKAVTLKENVSFGDVAKVEARKIDFPGLQVEVIGSREYIYGRSAAHVTGYLGLLNIQQLRSPEYRGLPGNTVIGQFGIEKVHDADLRGIAGRKIIEVNAVGNIMKVVRIQKPLRGRDVKLSIDMDLQREAELALRGKAGAIVAIDPGTGEILVMASAPSFDPNLFRRGIGSGDWKRLIKNPKKPMLNRAIQSQYPPGSTFKIITAIAALEQGLITEDTNFYCNGSIYYGRVFKCWKSEGHGNVNLEKALAESCDVYFYEIAKKLNIDTLAQYAFGYGMGRPSGLRLEGEVSGIVPTSAWKIEKKQERWYRGETLNTVIGQGYLTATPVQMARLMAAVVNGGKLHEPSLLSRGLSDPEVEGVVKIKPENIDIVRNALMSVVSGKKGTGRFARSDLVSIGGKTGTSQVVSGVIKGEKVPEKLRDHAWFVAYAPEYNPEIAIAVFVEHGEHGSTGAAPLAKRIIETYYKKNNNLKEKKDSI